MGLELTAADRCDACQAQAWVRVWINTHKSDLLFCSHHFNAHKVRLSELDAMWYDESDKINAKLDVSA